MSTQLVLGTLTLVFFPDRESARGLSPLCLLFILDGVDWIRRLFGLIFSFMFLVSSTLERNRKTVAEIFETNWKRSVSIFQLADVKHRPPHCLHLSSKVSKRHFHWTRAMIRFPPRVIRDKFHYHLTSIYACRTHQLSILSSRTHTHTSRVVRSKGSRRSSSFINWTETEKNGLLFIHFRRSQSVSTRFSSRLRKWFSHQSHSRFRRPAPFRSQWNWYTKKHGLGCQVSALALA